MSKRQRDIVRLQPVVKRIIAIEEQLQRAPEGALQEKTRAWQRQLAELSGDDKKVRAFLDRILPEAFAVVKNGARRLMGQAYQVCGREETWRMIPFDVQLAGGVVLHSGRVAEMGTGEGKTLVAALPLYLNGLAGRGAHLVTVNDYLALRDSEQIGFLLRYLGLTVGCIQQEQHPEARRAQYACDVTYGTNAEFGFDYLRDNGIAQTRAEKVQRGHWYAVLDEVDSVLIDEARTPLIITGPGEEAAHHYHELKPAVNRLLRRQGDLLNRVAQETGALREAGDMRALGDAMHRLKLGQPRHRVLLRLLEDAACVRALEHAELRYGPASQKRALAALKEEFFYTVDEKNRQVELHEKGRRLLSPEDYSGRLLPELMVAERTTAGGRGQAALEEVRARLESENLRVHNCLQLLRAVTLYERNVDYVIEEGKIVIVDEKTGRKMPGRRWSDGLHQAVEAKESLKVDAENRTLATITIQNYFRLYTKLAGMTGTAETEASELNAIYGLDVVVIPPNRKSCRIDRRGLVFPTRREKYAHAITVVKERHEKGQPVLIGTASVEASETLARMMRREGIPHQVLNAVNHAGEAELVARAGLRGAVTISTNMAGRGTDIRLGEGIEELGGLFVLGLEHHESRRIDRQLRGRSARQGDPGETAFLVSLEDPLLMHHAGEARLTALAASPEEKQPSAQRTLAAAAESAQRQQEQLHFLQRKRTLDFDDVLNRQRTIIYGLRNEVLDSAALVPLLTGILEETVEEKVEECLHPSAVDNDSAQASEELVRWASATFHSAPAVLSEKEMNKPTPAAWRERLLAHGRTVCGLEIAETGGGGTGGASTSEDAAVEHLRRAVILGVIDRHWQDHLSDMEALRDGIHFQQFAQKDPLIEYKTQAHALFDSLTIRIRTEVLQTLALRRVVSFAAAQATVLNAAEEREGGHEAQMGAVA